MISAELILPKRFPDLFKGDLKPWTAILLYGPPGTGKSFFAKAVATESKSAFLSVSPSDTLSTFYGGSEKLVQEIFVIARANVPAVLFVDEIDSILRKRTEREDETTRRVKNEFLVQVNIFC